MFSTYLWAGIAYVMIGLLLTEWADRCLKNEGYEIHISTRWFITLTWPIAAVMFVWFCFSKGDEDDA